MSIPAHHIPEIAALETQITELAAHIHAATYRLLCLIAEFDERDGWADWGICSCAHWLNWRCGIALGAAREKVRVARALPGLPKISAAFEKGELSYSKVRAITRIADSVNEDYLVMIARHGTAMHVEKLVRKFRRVGASEAMAAANQVHETRYLTYYHDDDGALVIKGRMPAEQGALLLKALEMASEALREEPKTGPHDVSAETSDASDYAQAPPSAQRMDGLILMAETLLERGPGTGQSREHYVVNVHVDAQSLQDDSDCGRCELEDGPSLAPETARRLCCDASLVHMLDDAHGEPLNVSRKTRSIPPAMKRALRARDQGCRFPGCTHTRFVDGHHIEHWAQGGETSIKNLMLLCRFHHHLVHEGGFSVSSHAGRFMFVRPDGRPIRAIPEPVELNRNLVTQNRQLGLMIDADTCVPLWDGEPMDYHMAVDGLLASAARPKAPGQ